MASTEDRRPQLLATVVDIVLFVGAYGLRSPTAASRAVAPSPSDRQEEVRRWPARGPPASGLFGEENDSTRYEPANSPEIPRFGGVRTFMRLPNAAIVGAPFDNGASFGRGRRYHEP